MGTLTLDSQELVRKYGVLGVRFNTLRAFYKCVVEAQGRGDLAAAGCSK